MVARVTADREVALRPREHGRLALVDGHVPARGEALSRSACESTASKNSHDYLARARGAQLDARAFLRACRRARLSQLRSLPFPRRGPPRVLARSADTHARGRAAMAGRAGGARQRTAAVALEERVERGHILDRLVMLGVRGLRGAGRQQRAAHEGRERDAQHGHGRRARARPRACARARGKGALAQLQLRQRLTIAIDSEARKSGPPLWHTSASVHPRAIAGLRLCARSLRAPDSEQKDLGSAISHCEIFERTGK